MASVGSTTSLFNLLINAFIGISVGANVLVARYCGEKNYDGVQQTVGALLYGKAYFVLNDSVKSDMLAGDFAMRWEITQNINIKSITGTVQRTDEGLVAYYDELIALNE